MRTTPPSRRRWRSTVDQGHEPGTPAQAFRCTLAADGDPPFSRRAAPLESLLIDLGGEERLFVITPDVCDPKMISALGDPRPVLFSFRSLHLAIDSIAEIRPSSFLNSPGSC